MSTAVSAERTRSLRRREERPWRGSIRRIASLTAATAVCVVSALLGSGATPASAGGPEVTGGGSSYAAVAINNWDQQFYAITGDDVNYGVSSSVQGLNEFAQSQIDVGASEIGYSTNQANYTPSFKFQYLPDVAGATCLMYNLAGINKQPITELALDSQVMLGIFTGQIKYWDDPQIKALNPLVASLLPHEQIVVVWREDPSGDNYLFSQYLWFEDQSGWNAYSNAMGFGNGADALWPFPQSGGGNPKYNLGGWIGASGSDIASNDTAAQSGAITYVETAYALLHNKPCAYVKNASGHYVAPSEYDDSVGLEGARLLPDLEQKLDGVYTNPQPDAYPISAYSYLVTEESEMNPGKGAVLGKYILYIACQGQQSAGPLGYAPLPPNLVQDDFDAVDRIAGAPRAPSAPTAANCKDPYVDGQTPLPGEPQQSGGGPSGDSGSKGTTGTTGASGPTGHGGSTGTTGQSGTSGHSGAHTTGGSKGKGKGHHGGTTGTSGQTGANVLPTGPAQQSQHVVAGIALLGAVGKLQNGVGPRTSSLLWLVGAAVVVLGGPLALLTWRRRSKTSEAP